VAWQAWTGSSVAVWAKAVAAKWGLKDNNNAVIESIFMRTIMGDPIVEK